jgi:DNA-binding transcriptional LysR family regulator
LVAPPSFTEGVLPDIAALFIAKFPQVHLTIDSHNLEAAKALIATRAVDAASSGCRSIGRTSGLSR